MSSMTILNAIHASAAAVLEPLGYQGMAFVSDLARNKNTQLGKRYGVRPSEIEEAPGAARAITLDQTFEIVFTDLMPYPLAAIADAWATLAVAETIDVCKGVYGQLVATKCGIPETVLNVKTLKVNLPVYDFDAKAFHVVASFKVTYRQA